MGYRLLFAALLSAGGLLISQQKVGPWVGLRSPLYDSLKRGYWYLKLSPLHFQIDPDPAGTSDGILTLRTPATMVLAQDVSGSYLLPVGTRLRTKVYRNGVWQALGLDYSIVSDAVVPAAAHPWSPGDLVLVDGE